MQEDGTENTELPVDSIGVQNVSELTSATVGVREPNTVRVRTNQEGDNLYKHKHKHNRTTRSIERKHTIHTDAFMKLSTGVEIASKYAGVRREREGFQPVLILNEGLCWYSGNTKLVSEFKASRKPKSTRPHQPIAT